MTILEPDNHYQNQTTVLEPDDQNQNQNQNQNQTIVTRTRRRTTSQRTPRTIQSIDRSELWCRPVTESNQGSYGGSQTTTNSHQNQHDFEQLHNAVGIKYNQINVQVI